MKFSPSFDQLPDSGLIRLSDLLPAVIPVSRATLWRRVADGTFPRPVKLSNRVSAWRVCDVRRWSQEQTAEAA
jgi:predicted DNA-binding transcriptional regulator AlpA